MDSARDGVPELGSVIAFALLRWMADNLSNGCTPTCEGHKGQEPRDVDPYAWGASKARKAAQGIARTGLKEARVKMSTTPARATQALSWRLFLGPRRWGAKGGGRGRG